MLFIGLHAARRNEKRSVPLNKYFKRDQRAFLIIAGIMQGGALPRLIHMGNVGVRVEDLLLSN